MTEKNSTTVINFDLASAGKFEVQSPRIIIRECALYCGIRDEKKKGSNNIGRPQG